jgi:hypothetical protein
MPYRGPFYEVDAPVREYRDSRSGSISRKRGRAQWHKYMKYQDVDRKQANQPHYSAPMDEFFIWVPKWPANIEECPVIDKLPKRKFYEMTVMAANFKPCTCCSKKSEKWDRKEVEFRRGSRWAREQALKWTKSADGIVPHWWRWAADTLADCPRGLIHLSDWCPCDDYQPDVDMTDIVASRGACFVFRGLANAGGDTDSVVSAYSDDWSEVGSIASWDDYTVIDGNFVEDESEVEME